MVIFLSLSNFYIFVSRFDGKTDTHMIEETTVLHQSIVLISKYQNQLRTHGKPPRSGIHSNLKGQDYGMKLG